MSDNPRQPVLHLIACSVEAAPDLEPFIRTCQELGWDVHAIVSPTSTHPVDRDVLARLTGHPVCEDDQLGSIRSLPPAGAYAVAPASFEIVNKWAYGNNDNLALRLLNDATGLGLPIVAIPAPGPALARHPAFLESVARLRAWGVTVVFDPAQQPLPGCRETDDHDRPFPWHVATQVIAHWTRFARIPAPGTYQGEFVEPGDLPAQRRDDLALLAPQSLPVMPLAS
ncbi:MAG TPA: flavoprotein [Micromonosporaceae bacterium]